MGAPTSTICIVSKSACLTAESNEGITEIGMSLVDGLEIDQVTGQLRLTSLTTRFKPRTLAAGGKYTGLS